MMNESKKEQALLEAVQSAETAAIRLRQYAAAELTGRQSDTSVSGEAKDITSVEFTTEGWLSLLLPAMLPKRADGDCSRFLASLLRDAIRREYQETLPLKFRTCVLVYEHIYDISHSHRFIDHDNLELKHCQDVLEAAFLTNDTAALCSAFQCSHRGKQDGTRIWILPPEQFPEWLKNHSECWNSTTETMQE